MSRYGGPPGCTCDPEPRASDGSENGLCAACEDEVERGQAQEADADQGHDPDYYAGRGQ